MKKVFISYVHEDSDLVDRLCEDLRNHGIDIWIDKESLQPGQFWPDVIRKAIREGDFFIACFSKNYTQKIKSFMNEELTVAIDELRKRPRHVQWFMPLLLSGDLPDFDIGGGKSIKDIHCLNLDDNKWENCIRILVKTLQSQGVRIENSQSLQREESNPIKKASHKVENVPTWEEWKDNKFLLTAHGSIAIFAMILCTTIFVIAYNATYTIPCGLL